MIYVMSDIHGSYDKYIEILNKINLSSKDTLYILGDVIDRGDEGIKILLDMMRRPNIIPILGNHEYMAYDVLSKLNIEITDDFEKHMDMKTMLAWQDWLHNGGESTQREFISLHHSQRERILDYLLEFSVYEIVSVNGMNYILVHGGLDNFSKEKMLDEYSIHDIVWARTDYEKQYYPDKILVTGHTPTVLIDKNCRGRIYKKNNHIAIDCGAIFGIALGCICLDTSEEFYA